MVAASASRSLNSKLRNYRSVECLSRHGISSTHVLSQSRVKAEKRLSEAAVSFFETIATETRKRHLPFLIIGGHAINLYGFARETADVDFLICADNRTAWLELLTKLGYRVFSDGGSFVQLSSDQQSAWPLDLMLVQKKTFQPMLADSREVEFYGTTSRIPSLEHLIALKLHALKNTRVNRFLKDYLDVENLIQINHLDIKSKKIRLLFTKYGTLALYEKMRATLDQE